MTKMKKLEEKLIRLEENSKNFLTSIFEAEAGELARAFIAFLQVQFKIRPRARLISKILPALAVTYLASSGVVSFIEPREAEIKIMGQPVIAVAGEENMGNLAVAEAEIAQEVNFRRSPFELAMPVDGYISQGFRSYHRAYDIATSLSTPIHPVGSGVVDFAGFTADGKGNVVVVDHGDGLKSLYAHMGKITVGVGNMVDAKTILGTVGLTGRTTGAHVHLEIYDNGVSVNPGNLLPQN